MKKFISVLLIMMMVVSFAACGEEAPAPEIVGVYETELDLSADAAAYIDAGFMSQGLQLSSAQYMNPVKIKLVVEFGPDGRYKCYYDEASVTAAVESVKTTAYKCLDELLYAALRDGFAQRGVTAESAEDYSALTGLSADDMLLRICGGTDPVTFVDSIFDFAAMEESLKANKAEGNFTAQGGRLALSASAETVAGESSYESYELAEGGLTLTGGENVFGSGESGAVYPLVFTKVG